MRRGVQRPPHLTSYHDLRYTVLTDSLAGPVCSVCGISNSFPSLSRQSRQFRGTTYIGPREIIALYPDRFRGAGSFHQLVQRRASSARGRLIPAPSFIIQIHLAPRALRENDDSFERFRGLPTHKKRLDNVDYIYGR